MDYTYSLPSFLQYPLLSLSPFLSLSSPPLPLILLPSSVITGASDRIGHGYALEVLVNYDDYSFGSTVWYKFCSFSGGYRILIRGFLCR